MFFDGTLNNRANTKSYARLARAAQKEKAETSYANDLSNIARLEEVLQVPHAGFDHSFKIYVEGIGTFDAGDDSTTGKAFGTGDSGVPAKVESGLARCAATICGQIPLDTTIHQIVLDSLGFSRGAAAARYFVHRALDVKDGLAQRLRDEGYTVGTVIVRFVGLFDTVASYDVDHTNDTADLRLDAIRVAEKVVHLVAGEEHRKNFPLTNIASAGANGVEHYLPGVHSDVGGSYVDKAGENVQFFDLDTIRVGAAERTALDREVTWALDRGWYHLGDFAKNHGKTPAQQSRTHLENFWNEIHVSRAEISNVYARIPLHIMADYGTQKQLVWSNTLKLVYAVPPELLPSKILIEIAIYGSPKPDQDRWLNSVAPWHKELRYKHLHMSSFYGETLGACTPQWTGGYQPAGGDPVRGLRRRVVQQG